MDKVTVKLEFLDKMINLVHNGTIPVFLNNDPDQQIGTCEIKSINSSHFGEFSFDKEVDHSLFLYYGSEPEIFNPAQPYYLINISLHEKERKGEPTKQLNEMIVKML